MTTGQRQQHEKTKENPNQCGRNHFLKKENLDLGDNDGRSYFRLIMTKNHQSFLENKGVKRDNIGKDGLGIWREEFFFTTKHFSYNVVNCPHYDSNPGPLPSLYPTYLNVERFTS